MGLAADEGLTAVRRVGLLVSGVRFAFVCAFRAALALRVFLDTGMVSACSISDC